MNVWTPEMLAAFNRLYCEQPELTFVQIAAAMSSLFGITLTRNACIGKAHRLGLPMRSRGGAPRWPRKPYAYAKKEKAEMIKLPVDAPIPPADTRLPDVILPSGITIYQLRDNTCHWPLGPTFARPPFLYCGKPALFDRPYCRAHMAKATNQRYEAVPA